MWLGHLISCLSCVNSSGIALTGISPNTSSAYVEKKTSTNLHHLPPGKKQERGKRGCIYIGPDHLSRFDIQTGTKTTKNRVTSFSRGSYTRPRLIAAAEIWAVFFAAAENSFSFLLFIFFSSFQNSFRIFLCYHVPYTFA